MLSTKIKSGIENATVKLTKKVGQGVLIPGGFILTAAHCVEWSLNDEMVLGDDFSEPITTKGGHKLNAVPYAVEPCKDIAVLGSPDQQARHRDAKAFEGFCEQTQPVPLCLDSFDPFEPVAVWILAHSGAWISAIAKHCSMDSTDLYIDADEQIEGGTSGGPIVDSEGRLLGVVSWFSEAGERCDGNTFRPQLALPVWVVKKITAQATMP